MLWPALTRFTPTTSDLVTSMRVTDFTIVGHIAPLPLRRICAINDQSTAADRQRLAKKSFHEGGMGEGGKSSTRARKNVETALVIKDGLSLGENVTPACV